MVQNKALNNNNNNENGNNNDNDNNNSNNNHNHTTCNGDSIKLGSGNQRCCYSGSYSYTSSETLLNGAPVHTQVQVGKRHICCNISSILVVLEWYVI